MVRRISNAWLAEETHPAIGIALEHMGTSWAVAEREKVFKTISYAFFPPNRRADAWPGYDQTHHTVKAKPYYPVIVPLGTSPDAWFKNLRLLQVRQRLNLITSLRLSMLNPPSCISGEVFARMDALKRVVGKNLAEAHKIPKTKKPKMRTTRNIADVATTSSRNRGLAARDRRN